MMWANPAGGDWDTASNWVNAADPSDQHVPTASDAAAIDLPDITVTHDSGTDSVNSITSQDPIAIDGGSLTIATASMINSTLTLAFNSLIAGSGGGTLEVNGPLAVNGLFTLGAETALTGSGTVDAYGGLNINGADVSIRGTTLNNHGAATWDIESGNDSLSAGAVFNNLAGATVAAVGAAGSYVGGDGVFNNAGTFTSTTAASGDDDFVPVFNNSGTVDLQGGELELEGDGVTPGTGTFIGASGTYLDLANEVLAPSSVVSSDGIVAMIICTDAGSYRAAGGTVADDATFTGPVESLGSSLEVSGSEGGSVSFTPAVGGPVTLTTGTLTVDPDATLSGTDSFVVDGLLTLSSATTDIHTQLSVGGTVDAYGGLVLGLNVDIRGTTLINHGAGTGDTGNGAINLSDGAAIDNLAGATFAAVGGFIVGGDGTFDNAGTFTASTDFGGYVNIGAAVVENTGTIVVQAGELDVTGNGVTPITGTINAAAGTALYLGNLVLAPGSVISSAGRVTLDECTEEGTFSTTGSTVAVDTSFTGPVLDLGSSLEVDDNTGAVSFAPAVGGPVTLTVGNLAIDTSATLTGTDSFVVDGLLTLSTTTLSTDTTLSVAGTVDAYGGIDLGSEVVIKGTTLNNHGAATWDCYGYYDLLDAGATINNLAGATFSATGSQGGTIQAGDGSAVAFHNAGTLISSTAPASAASITVPFVNAGSVDLEQGTLNLSGDGVTPSTGTITAAAGTDLGLNNLVLAPGTVVSSNGFVSVTGCTVAGSFGAAGGTYAQSSSFTGTVLDLRSSLEVYGTVSFDPASGGLVPLTTGTLTIDPNSVLTGTDSFVANGLMTLSPDSSLSISGNVDAYGGLAFSDGYVYIQGTTLDNFGAATWDLGPSAYIQLDAGAVINNMAGASFATVGANSGANDIADGDGSAVAFNNAGTFTSSAPVGIDIAVPFVNTGSVVVERGYLSVSNITGSGTVTVAPGASFNGSGSLQSPIIVSSGETLTTTPGETITGSLILAGGTLDATGQLTVDGALALENGSTLTGSGPVDAYGGLSISGDVAISTTSLNNHGLAIWDESASGPNNVVTLFAGAVINNLADATFTSVVGSFLGGEIIAGDSSAVAFNNAGTFLCQQGSQGGRTIIGVPFTQTASGATVVEGPLVILDLTGDIAIAGSMTVDAEARLVFESGGTVSGSLSGATGSLIYFYGPAYTLDASSNVTSAGTVLFEDVAAVAIDGTYDVSGSTQLYSGTVTFTGEIADLGSDLNLYDSTLDITTAQSLSLTSVEIYGGTLSGAGSGEMTVTGSMSWEFGTISDLGSLTIASGATLDLGGLQLSLETLDDTTLYNAGMATLTSVYYPDGIALQDGAGIDNGPGGSFTLLDAYEGAYIDSDNSPTFFANAGSLILAGETDIQAATFTETSTGSTVLESGSLEIAGSASICGSVSAALGTTVTFDGPSTSFGASSSLTSAGTVVFLYSTTTVGGAYDVSGVTIAYDADVNFTEPITDLGAGLEVVNGTLDITTNQSFRFTDLSVSGIVNGGGGDLTVTGSMTWNYGAISGFGTLSIPGQATLALGTSTTNGTETLSGVTLNNAGATTLSSNAAYSGFGLTLESNAVVDNEPGASFTFLTGATISSDGTATAFINSGNVIQATPAGAPSSFFGSFIQTDFTQTGTGSIAVSGGSLELDGVSTLSGSSTAALGSMLAFAGPSTNLEASSSVTGAGTLLLENSVSIAGAYDVTGTTVAYSSNGVTFTAPIADLGAYLDIDAASVDITTNQSLSLSYLNAGPLSGGGGNLTITGSMYWGGGTISGFGTVTIAPGATLDLPDGRGGTEFLSGVTLDNAGATTFLGYSIYSGLALENGAAFVNEPGATFTILTAGPISSDGTATSFINEGALINPATAIGQTVIGPAFTQTSTGTTVVADSELSLVGTGSPVTTAGNVTVESGGTLTVSTDYDQSAGSTTLEYGDLDGGNVNITGGSLVGVGTVNGDVWSAGTVIPGGIGAAGVLVINGTYTQTASGSLDVDLGGTMAGSQYDQLVVSGSATLAGTLNVALIDGFEPVLGDAFQVMTFASSTGVFTDYNGMVVGNQLILSPIFNPGDLTLSILPATTTTTLSPAVSPSVSGQSVTFTATVSVARPATTADPSPTGTVTFFDNGHSIGSGMLSLLGGQDRATFTTNLLSTASHSITAAYTSGDPNFEPSPVSASITQVVNPAGTSTTVATSGSPSGPGQTVVFTATVSVVSPGSTAVASPTGTVTFYDSGVAIGTETLSIVSGQDRASFSTSSLATGSHSITAAYTSGDGNFNPSPISTAITQVVSAPASGQSIIVLDPTAGGALSLSGNASIKLAGEVVVDSSSSSALAASGNAQISASVIDVHGGVSKSGNASFSPAPITGAATVADPLASLAEPGTAGLVAQGAETLSGNSTATIQPGIYSQITASGNAKLTLSSGIYLIEGGGFSISGNAGVTGSGVLIVNTGSKYPTTGGTYGGITLSGNGSYNLSPMTTGAYAGIVIFQTRDNSTALTISGNASGMSGMIYAPKAALTESGNAALDVSLIVDTLSISGNGAANTVTLDAAAGTLAYAPAQIRTAYGIDKVSLDGTGETITIVDAYDDPSIRQALDTFDSQFGLTATGPSLYDRYGPAASFLTVLNQYGQATSLPTTDPNGPGTDNWEVEESLDVEWVHAIAPGAQIILVEANSQSLSDLMTGVATAASQPGVSVVSMSWGFAEGQAVFAADEVAYDHVFDVPGVTFVASTGDYGAADPEYPAFSPNVVAVGGTSLTLNGDGSYNSETGWGYYSDSVGAFIGSGGGISLYEPEPAYQLGVQSTGMRTTPDVSLVADPSTGAWIADPYNLDPSNPFEVVGGTSLSAPAWAGLVALVNQSRAAAGESTLNSTSPTDTQQALYMLPQSDYNEISSGNNGYAAGAGYNLVTGLGTPVANLLVPDLVAYDGPGTSYSGSTVAPLLDASLVDTGSTSSGLIDVFSVFDSITVTHAGQSQKRSALRLDSSIERTSAPAVQSKPSTPISIVDQGLEIATDESLQETLIGDLAFEQVSNGTRKAP